MLYVLRFWPILLHIADFLFLVAMDQCLSCSMRDFHNCACCLLFGIQICRSLELCLKFRRMKSLTLQDRLLYHMIFQNTLQKNLSLISRGSNPFDQRSVVSSKEFQFVVLLMNLTIFRSIQNVSNILRIPTAQTT